MNSFFSFFFFFNDTATTEIYTLSLHDALPISLRMKGAILFIMQTNIICKLTINKEFVATQQRRHAQRSRTDRKSTRLNSSHLVISYAVFCLKKKKNP